MHRSLLLAAVLIAACEPTTAPVLSLSNLAGTWDVAMWERAAVHNTALKEDVLADGTRGILTIARNGEFASTVSTPGRGTFAETGRISLRGDTLVYDGENDEAEFKLEFFGNRMRWLALERELHDVNHDGAPEETLETVGFSRR